MDNETAHVAFGEAGGIFRPPAFSTSLDFSSRQVRLLIVTVVAAYPILVSLLRFRRVRWLHRKYHYPTRESLSCMTDNEAWEIQKILLQLEFPFIYIKALQFALFRVCLSSISEVELLMRSGLYIDIWNSNYIKAAYKHKTIL